MSSTPDPAPLGTFVPEPAQSGVPGPRRSGGRALVLVGVGVFVTIAAIVGLLLVVKKPVEPRAFELRGTMTLEKGATAATRGRGECAGERGYDDIAEGAQVTVYDAAGKAVALGELADSAYEGAGQCSFTFAVAEVPVGARIYQIEVTHRGKVSFEESAAKAGEVALTLG
ncbi:hypothetical protein ACQPZF_14860 [Actinosynnema sp. CS-041913]|uniref:hypothetical protein n=1 Tax=Actinosynnema sp. CS-041913 TaxID=3239917 RepID=UPI003D8BB911